MLTYHFSAVTMVRSVNKMTAIAFPAPADENKAAERSGRGRGGSVVVDAPVDPVEEQLQEDAAKRDEATRQSEISI